jgi:acyl-CoA synthetase (AMP-forming)/AMP-acid ligase II
MPGIELRIVDVETREPLPPGQAGEVEVGGYSLMTGFYKKERHETFTRDGLYPTGDVMSQDEEGYLTFSHRIGDMIKVHGANVAPQEVEMALLALPPVARAAVIGLPDPAGGSVVVAAVELHPGHAFDEAAIRAHLRTQLSSYKTPRRIVALKAEELPFTGSGKIHKPRLAPIIAARLEAEDEAAA